MASEIKYVFVTVGTTYFDELIQEADKIEFHMLLKKMGYEGIIMQIGNCTYTPTNSTLLKDNETPFKVQQSGGGKGTSNAKLKSYYYRFKPSLADDMQNSSLIISHGGSGSILEALEFHKPCVCVTNSRLMDNHQVELAQKLSQSPYQYLLPCDPSTLYTTINDQLSQYLQIRLQFDENQIENSLKSYNSMLNKEMSTNTKGKKKKNGGNRAMVVLGSGGHTAEMFYLLKYMDRKNTFNHITYVLADSDKRSNDKIDIHESKYPSKSTTIKRIPRSRNVGQSYLNSIFTTLYSLYFCLILVFREKLDVIICNGPGTCVPLCFAVWLFNLLHIKDCKIVYIESIARVQHLSLSAKIVQHIANWMVVPWPELMPQVKTKNKWCNNIFFDIRDSNKIKSKLF